MTDTPRDDGWREPSDIRDVFGDDGDGGALVPARPRPRPAAPAMAMAMAASSEGNEQ